MAIIGMGGMAEWHFGNVNEHVKGITITAGYDIDAETSTNRAKEWNIKTYKNPKELYEDKKIDLVLIATPNDSHKEYSINAMKSGKHVICEKPVNMNVAELLEVMATAKETGKLFTVHQNRRWDQDYLIAKKILAEGLVGDPYTIESRAHGSKRLYGWRAFKPNGGGILLDWGVHLIDQMLDLIKEDVVSVYGHLTNLPGSEVDDCFTATLRFANGCAGIIDVRTNSLIVQPRWHINGFDGTAVVENWECDGKIVQQADPNEPDWTEAVIYTAAGPTKTMLPRPKETTRELELPKVGERSWTDFYKNLVDVLNGKAKPIVTPEQALRVMKVIEAIFESDKTGTAVTRRI